MYEGGHREPTVFKALDIKAGNENPHNLKIDSLIWLINQSEIVKAQKETDTRRFVGDPELEVIHFKLSDNFNWTLFNLVSEEKGKKENFDKEYV